MRMVPAALPSARLPRRGCGLVGWSNARLVRPKKFRDVIGRRNSRLDQERALRAIAFVIVG